MRNTLLILALLITANLYSKGIDTLTFNSKIKNVTVFFDGAQIVREGKINVIKGKHLLVLEKLPAEINPQSIQIINNQKGKILSVKHELTYPSEKNKTVIEFEEKIKQQELKTKEIYNKINVFEIEEKILIDNSILKKKNDGTTISEIKEASIFYREKLNEIRQQKLNLSVELLKIKEKIQDLYLELNKKIAQDNKTYSKISFIISCEAAINSSFKLSYFVSSAGWRPLYDFRVNNINKPLNLVYNANIFQSTGENWKNVNLILSTNRPSLSNTKPELATWFINRENSYKKKNIIEGQSALKGVVTDKQTGDPLPFAKVVVSKDGELITGGTTDFDGRFNIKPIKSGYYVVTVSYIGYTKSEVRGVVLDANKITIQDFKLSESAELLQEMMVHSYKVPLIDKDGGASGGTVTREDLNKMPSRSAASSRVVSSRVGGVRGSRSEGVIYFVDGYKAEANITSIEYNIDIPYSIPSDGKDYNIKIKEVKIPVNYTYYSIPKLDNDAFLIAELNNWERLNLLSGETSIYYKGTFTGQSVVDSKSTKDTLEISLNRDKNIIVERTLLKEKNEKQFIGNNIKETINWSITIKNNKSEKVKILIEDQFPISENKSVIIEQLENSDGKINDKTGQVLWDIELQANQKKELILKYSVKYPKNMKVKTE